MLPACVTDFFFPHRDILAQKLIKHLNEGNELFLEPLYDLSAAFANDIQGQYFWPYFGQFIEAFGTSFLAIKETPEIIQSGYTALTQIIRMVMRSVDQKENDFCEEKTRENGGAAQNQIIIIKSLEVLKLCLNGLMKNEKGTLPAHTHKLCASAFGQIIRRSKTKIECIEFLLEKCKSSQGNTELPAQILVRALKTTEKTVQKTPIIFGDVSLIQLVSLQKILTVSRKFVTDRRKRKLFLETFMCFHEKKPLKMY